MNNVSGAHPEFYEKVLNFLCNFFLKVIKRGKQMNVVYIEKSPRMIVKIKYVRFSY